jgi:hypothetical protein
MNHAVRSALLATAALALASCAEPAAPPPAAAPSPSTVSPTFTAAPGDIMVLSDRCVGEVCDHAAASSLPGVTELVYMGMLSPTEAVFLRRQVPDYTGPTTPTGIPGLVVPTRPEVPADVNAPFVPRRSPADLPAGATALVVDPIAGAQFGVEDMAVNVTTIAPGRVIYTVEQL